MKLLSKLRILQPKIRKMKLEEDKIKGIPQMYVNNIITGNMREKIYSILLRHSVFLNTRALRREYGGRLERNYIYKKIRIFPELREMWSN